ncbi:MAG: F0F1 ATP synthase subunit epsilon [Thermomicrobiaceae bacterium]
MAKLSVEIITGERVVYEESDVDMVVAPGADGALGLLPNHAPLFTLLSLGEMRVVKGGEEQSLAVFGGFLEIAGDHVRILADAAERAEEIDVDRAEEARQRAESFKSEGARATEDMIRAEAAMRRSMVRLKISRRRQGRQQSGGGSSPSAN